ncbi:TolC family protein [Methyloglobulus sp.]|uniref:TolC family protein n=1 Tax=Methyloglobulus sp. TaxID=2518622 RepID=UPI0032B75F5C
MFVSNLITKVLTVFLLIATVAAAEPKPTVAHEDPIEIDKSLTLSKVVDLTMEKFPDMAWLNSLEEEAVAIKQRGESWTAGASQAGLRYQNMTSGTVNYVDATVQVPLWNLGQRDAEQERGIKAENSADLQSAATKLRIAGLVRAALWDMELQKIRYEQARAEINVFEQLLAKVERRVELGDLPRADVLLAQTELLQKLSTLTQAEAELMHARKRYSSITQLTKTPAIYQEKLVALKKIEFNHPIFVAINSQIERKQAEIKALKLVGSGQTNLTVGVNSDRTQNNDPRSNQTESFNVGVNIPFGGAEHLQPQIAAQNVELNRLIANREQLFRDLELAHHEAEHNLEVNQAELEIANELKRVAEEHLGMMQLSFSVGELNLMDLLKTQSRTQQAILSAKERAIMLERDIALYNQAVGVLP